MDEVSAQNYSFQKVIVAVGFILLVTKSVAWFITSSVAIMTDALESVVNVVAGMVGLYALYLAAKPPDEDHPFGHGGAETISSSVEGVMIIIAGALIIMEAIMQILTQREVRELNLGLILVAAAGVVNYVVGRMAISRGRKNRSPALEASGKHLCTDTYTSLGILLGLFAMQVLIASGYNVLWIDGAIALVFGIIILYTGAGVIKDSMDAVLGKADSEVLESVLASLNRVRHEDWIDIHAVRVMKVGGTLHIDMHIVLPAKMTVAEQHYEIAEAKGALRKEFGNRVDINITTEPCRYADCPHCARYCEDRSREFEEKVRWTVSDICRKGYKR